MHNQFYEEATGDPYIIDYMFRRVNASAPNAQRFLSDYDVVSTGLSTIVSNRFYLSFFCFSLTDCQFVLYRPSHKCAVYSHLACCATLCYVVLRCATRCAMLCHISKILGGNYFYIFSGYDQLSWIHACPWHTCWWYWDTELSHRPTGYSPDQGNTHISHNYHTYKP